MKQDIFKVPKTELDRLLADGINSEITKSLARGIPVAMSDEKGVYRLHPDGKKEYVKLYETADVADE